MDVLPPDGPDRPVPDDFMIQLDALDRRATDLADRLARAVEALRGSGAALCARLLEELTVYGSDLAALDSSLKQAASRAGIDSTVTGDGISVAGLRHRLEGLARAADRLTSFRAGGDRAVAALGRLAMSTPSDPTAEPLAARLTRSCASTGSHWRMSCSSSPARSGDPTRFWSSTRVPCRPAAVT
jgi:hypothetical protein